MADHRIAFRVEVPDNFLLELAVWLRRKSDMGRLHLKDLGDPKMLWGKPPHPRLEDLSSTGGCVSFASAGGIPLERFDNVVVLVYFKLVDPTDPMGDPLSFLEGFEPLTSQYNDGRNYLGMRLAYDGVPDPSDKAVFFTDARKYGVADLTKWCDDMNRQSSSQNYLPPPGLRLERLLSELTLLREDHPRAAAQKTSG